MVARGVKTAKALKIIVVFQLNVKLRHDVLAQPVSFRHARLVISIDRIDLVTNRSSYGMGKRYFQLVTPCYLSSQSAPQ